ncbi:DnaJ family molecular chaperone [Hyphomicrobium sp. ghe19]|uniref:J domain-containing protein n=1 Tax=Hyphomicrobium sp. ghe19 TaxID=2682968 RepID=UPI001366E25D|nr:Co-chaperone protein DjlA [Hyphomicrobium sp. ghe19]
MPWQFLKNAVAAYGGGLRSALENVKGAFGLEGGHAPAQSRVAFTIAVVALAAKMSKADGVSLPIEAEAFKRQFQVPDSECAHVRKLYELASQDVAGYETYAAQIARILEGEPDLKISVLECLFHIASADGVLHPAEDRYLAHVAEIFGLTPGEFRCVRRGFVVDADGPYEVLHISPTASDKEIKARYRELVKGHHPDALVSKGVPPEFLAGAERRLQAITTAYEAILEERGQRVERALEPTT